MSHRFRVLLVAVSLLVAGLVLNGQDRLTYRDASRPVNERVADLLRCPVCQGLSINDSPAEMAVQMKAQTRELLAAGYSEEQILLYYEKSYGQFVRLEPPRSGINWIVWLAPALLFLFGIGFLALRFRRRRNESPSEFVAPPADEVDDELAPWLARVREIAYGEDNR